jgi:hypothetical protein
MMLVIDGCGRGTSNRTEVTSQAVYQHNRPVADVVVIRVKCVNETDVRSDQSQPFSCISCCDL